MLWKRHQLAAPSSERSIDSQINNRAQSRGPERLLLTKTFAGCNNASDRMCREVDMTEILHRPIPHAIKGALRVPNVKH